MRGVFGAPAALLLLSPALAAQAGEPFASGCPVAFADIAIEHALDSECGPEGDPQAPATAAQNRAKNNFCAQAPTARVTHWSFVRLQAAVDRAGITTGRPPSDRSALRRIYTTSRGDIVGEGSLVVFVGFVLEARYSNIIRGESVNCYRRGRRNNDIHLILDESLGVADSCHAVTAKISPHFRPEDWATGVLEDLGRPVRVTGQLFFDGSHVPCRPGRRASPPRASVWEIHPVYAIDVCRHRSLQRCPFDDESRWTPLHEFPTKDELEQDATGAID